MRKKKKPMKLERSRFEAMASTEWVDVSDAAKLAGFRWPVMFTPKCLEACVSLGRGTVEDEHRLVWGLLLYLKRCIFTQLNVAKGIQLVDWDRSVEWRMFQSLFDIDDQGQRRVLVYSIGECDRG